MTESEGAQLRSEVTALRVLVGSLSARLETLEHPQSSRVLIVKKTGSAWQEQGVESGAFVDYTDGRAGDGTGTQALLDLASGSVAVIEERDGDHCRYIPIGGGGNVSFCRVQMVSGDAGSDTSDCAYIYDLYELDNLTQINTTGGPITPNGPRRVARCTYGPATYGLYGKDIDGSYILVVIDENPNRMGC